MSLQFQGDVVIYIYINIFGRIKNGSENKFFESFVLVIFFLGWVVFRHGLKVWRLGSFLTCQVN